jgi:amidase
MSELVFRSAASLTAAIRNREISSLEVIDVQLTHIERTNPPLNAVVYLMAEKAQAEARHADAELAKGNVKGPFHGVPMSVKDAWEVAGIRSTGGTLGRANHIPERDATVITRMRAAGAIPIAMTNLPELSFAFESDNLVHGRTNNPYNLTRTPGGSGGGGGAAIASGMSPIEIGADLGRCPMTGYFPFR